MNADSDLSSPRAVPPFTGRQAQIAEIVHQEGRARVDALADLFGVASQTIRRDINAMCERGLLRRVHGGVELAAPNPDHYALRRILNMPAKREIGNAAADLIPEGVSIAASIGTTPEVAVTSLSQHRGLKIFTNNLHLAMTAYQFPGAEVTIPGGRLRKTEADIVGPSAESFFEGYKFDIGLFGVAAVDYDGALLDLSEEDVRSRAAISRNAATRILVLDVSKFGRRAHVRSGAITDVEHVVCNARPPEAIHSRLKAANVNLVIASAS